MEWMKADMGGAAAVIATLRAAAAAASCRSTSSAGSAIAENMPSGTAIRPSDVLTMRGGKTVEVMNTDAEGRLVMADAIVRAGRGVRRRRSSTSPPSPARSWSRSAPGSTP